MNVIIKVRKSYNVQKNVDYDSGSQFMDYLSDL